MLQFAVVAGLLTIVPGVDTALVLRAAMSAGRNSAFATVFGISSGLLIWGVTAALGISAVLTTSQLAFNVLRFAGAAYLLWLGIRMLRHAGEQSAQAETPQTQLPRAAFRRGLITNLLNPKVGVFYLAALPQFIPNDSNPALAGALLAAVHAAECIVWSAVLIAGTSLVKSWLGRPTVRLWLDRSTGLVLVGFGLRVAFDRG